MERDAATAAARAAPGLGFDQRPPKRGGRDLEDDNEKAPRVPREDTEEVESSLESVSAETVPNSPRSTPIAISSTAAADRKKDGVYVPRFDGLKFVECLVTAHR
ncbi:unnamed protein product [Spirodela intermedia]|uniref:Uncharacterized protein n=1 Tax=Spirodela intermedia TaxID=51605 RepID=A0A7I8IDZ2_SPIIN|nr:unnamed protein product [Spirodela intermedia]CAA6655879.1 unnamed protein product [Spirodela intermedia]